LAATGRRLMRVSAENSCSKARIVSIIIPIFAS
jgi:hypothetical protein